MRYFICLCVMVVFSVVAVNTVLACSFNTDCSVGSKCVKQSGGIYGVCVGGLNPGNSSDDRPARFFPDINGTYGKTCQFDTQCGPGGNCIKGSGIYGTCM